MKYLIIILTWSVYCILHSYLISIKFTEFMTRFLKNYYAFFRIFYNIFSFVLLIILIRYTDSLGSEFTITLTDTLIIIRYILTSATLTMFFWAFFFDYDSLSFFGVRQIMNFGKTKKINPEEEIKKTGLLGIVRHPMYLALIIFLWVNIKSEIDIIINIVLTIYIIIGTVVEEKKLVLEYGDAYSRYQREVPMLIPFTKR
jgi:methanethiol S-methyltransferase